MGTITRSFANLITASGPSAVADGSISITDLASGVGGKVLQVLTARDVTTRSTTSSSFVTGSNTLSVSITPSSASNKILIIANTTVRIQANSGSNAQVFTTIFRDAINLGTAQGLAYQSDGQSLGIEIFDGIGMNYLDSPNTTSATTYQVYFKTGGAGTAKLNESPIEGSITCLEIAG